MEHVSGRGTVKEILDRESVKETKWPSEAPGKGPIELSPSGSYTTGGNSLPGCEQQAMTSSDVVNLLGLLVMIVEVLVSTP